MHTHASWDSFYYLSFAPLSHNAFKIITGNCIGNNEYVIIAIGKGKPRTGVSYTFFIPP